jgi:hypothetical protein
MNSDTHGTSDISDSIDVPPRSARHPELAAPHLANCDRILMRRRPAMIDPPRSTMAGYVGRQTNHLHAPKPLAHYVAHAALRRRLRCSMMKPWPSILTGSMYGTLQILPARYSITTYGITTRRGALLYCRGKPSPRRRSRRTANCPFVWMMPALGS